MIFSCVCKLVSQNSSVLKNIDKYNEKNDIYLKHFVSKIICDVLKIYNFISLQENSNKLNGDVFKMCGNADRICKICPEFSFK